MTYYLTRPLYNAEVVLPSKVKKSTAATESTKAMYIDKVAAEFNRVLNNVNYKFLRSRKEAAEQSADARLKRVELLCALHTLFLDILYSISKPVTNAFYSPVMCCL